MSLPILASERTIATKGRQQSHRTTQIENLSKADEVGCHELIIIHHEKQSTVVRIPQTFEIAMGQQWIYVECVSRNRFLKYRILSRTQHSKTIPSYTLEYPSSEKYTIYEESAQHFEILSTSLYLSHSGSKMHSMAPRLLQACPPCHNPVRH